MPAAPSGSDPGRVSFSPLKEFDCVVYGFNIEKERTLSVAREKEALWGSCLSGVSARMLYARCCPGSHSRPTRSLGERVFSFSWQVDAVRTTAYSHSWDSNPKSKDHALLPTFTRGPMLPRFSPTLRSWPLSNAWLSHCKVTVICLSYCSATQIPRQLSENELTFSMLVRTYLHPVVWNTLIGASDSLLSCRPGSGFLRIVSDTQTEAMESFYLTLSFKVLHPSSKN